MIPVLVTELTVSSIAVVANIAYPQGDGQAELAWVPWLHITYEESSIFQNLTKYLLIIRTTLKMATHFQLVKFTGTETDNDPCEWLCTASNKLVLLSYKQKYKE